MSLAENRWVRLFTLCVLYVAQGIPWGFMAVTLPAYLADRKLDTAGIANIVAMAYLPFSFKIVWGPVMDIVTLRRFGRRRPWILFAQAMMALTVGAMIFIPDLTLDLDLLATMVLVHTIFNSMQDVAVDAFAVETLDESERARANGLMYASKYGGGIIGGAGMAGVMAWQGLRAALVVQTVALIAIMMVPLFLMRERTDVPSVEGDKPLARAVDVLKALVRAFTTRSALLGALLMLGASLAIGMLQIISQVLFIQHLHWKDTEFAGIVGGPGLAVGLGGSILGGFLADKVGHRRLAIIASCTLAAGWILFASAQGLWTDRWFIYTLVIVETTSYAVLNISLIALCMDISSPKIAATQFAGYMALSNYSIVRGVKLAASAQEWWTFPGIYFAAAAIQLTITLIIPFIDPHETRKKLGG